VTIRQQLEHCIERERGWVRCWRKHRQHLLVCVHRARAEAYQDALAIIDRGGNDTGR